MPRDLDQIREDILDKVEENNRIFVVCLVVATIIEVVCLVAFLWLMDFGDKLHWLILIAAIMVYWTLFCGLAALCGDIRRQFAGVLHALELHDIGKLEDAGALEADLGTDC